MPLNLLKKYNELLDIVALSEQQKKQSLQRIFNRDIVDNQNFVFRGKQIIPTKKEGIISMETLYAHLTTEKIDQRTNERRFELERSIRLHWIKFHIEENNIENILIFSVEEPNGFRTYIYDKEEKYVIVLEPLRNKNQYYLLSAHYIQGKDAQRNKFAKKYKRKLSEIL